MYVVIHGFNNKRYKGFPNKVFIDSNLVIDYLHTITNTEHRDSIVIKEITINEKANMVKNVWNAYQFNQAFFYGDDREEVSEVVHKHEGQWCFWNVGRKKRIGYYCSREAAVIAKRIYYREVKEENDIVIIDDHNCTCEYGGGEKCPFCDTITHDRSVTSDSDGDMVNYLYKYKGIGYFINEKGSGLTEGTTYLKGHHFSRFMTNEERCAKTFEEKKIAIEKGIDRLLVWDIVYDGDIRDRQ